MDDNMDALLNNNTTDKHAEANFIAWYEDVCMERIGMLEAEEGYTKRIKELENNNLELLQAFDEVQREIKQVRTKYEPKQDGCDADFAYLEPYDNVFTDREKLKKDKTDLKTKLKEAEKLIHELKQSITISNRPVKSSSSEFHSDSLTESEEFDLPVKWPKGKHRESISDNKRNNNSNKYNVKAKSVEVLTNPRYKPKKKWPRPRSKMCYLITGKEKIILLENENLTLRKQLKTIEHENELLTLQIDTHAKKIASVENASKVYVKSLRILNDAMGKQETIPRQNVTQENNKRYTANSYQSMFLSRKLPHKTSSSVSLPAIRQGMPITMIDSEALAIYFGKFSRRSVHLDASSYTNKMQSE